MSEQSTGVPEQGENLPEGGSLDDFAGSVVTFDPALPITVRSPRG